MITLHEQINLDRPAREVFAYACEFANCSQWDSTVVTAEKITLGPTGVDTQYRVVCATPVGKLKLEYRVLQWLPGEQVVLRGSCALFTVTDTISIAPTKTGSQLDYVAEFEFKPLLRPLETLMESGLMRMGKHSIEGLRQALESGYQAPRLSTRARLADTCIVPGVARFSKLGYRLSKKNWHPDSAYLGDRHMLLTGATSGIGLAAARELARRGASLTLVARDPQRGATVIEQLLAETGNQKLHLEIADMSVMADVQALVERLLRTDRPVDALINNAGALFNPRQETPEGVEKSLALLLLGPYLLTEGLLPLLERSAGARIINVVSGGMYTQKLDVSKLQHKQGNYSGSVAYARAKRALMIQTEQWAQAWVDKGIVCNAMHPGWADTPGVAQALPAFHRLTRRFLRSPEQGADTIVWMAAAREAMLTTGKLFLDREPHSPHLLNTTLENQQERLRLSDFLQAQAARFSTG